MFHLFPDFYCFTHNDKCLHAALEKLLGCGVDTISALRDVAQWFPVCISVGHVGRADFSRHSLPLGTVWTIILTIYEIASYVLICVSLIIAHNKL